MAAIWGLRSQLTTATAFAAVYGTVGEQGGAGLVDGDFQTVLGETDTQSEGETRGQLATLGCAGYQHDTRVGLAAEGIHRGEEQVGLIFGQKRMVDGVDPVRSVSNGLLRRGIDSVAEQAYGQLFAQRRGQTTTSGQQFGSGRVEPILRSLTYYQYPDSVSHSGLQKTAARVWESRAGPSLIERALIEPALEG